MSAACAFFTCNCHFHQSTPITPSVRADPYIPGPSDPGCFVRSMFNRQFSRRFRCLPNAVPKQSCNSLWTRLRRLRVSYDMIAPSVLNRDARARRQAPPRATLRRSLGLRGGDCAGRRLDSTTRRRATERRRAGKRRIEISLNENFVFQISTASREEHFVFGTGEKGYQLELSVNGSKCEGAGRVS